ncbi:lactate dehydrogenase [Citricoccus zhacaiensis]|uniref:Lactate dehydrogenase n=1 Tax=Citricoccus zhacaiensis TaxID=489142 RepID=A0ABQ2LSK5_9MICC|nr:FAD-binding and (Fe-S)-binding domain-containing protein [Citricoccus zhacaiensis]GGO42643.1 lactate dehydrogenase [Citricoccus zhacaiensis]
MDLETDLDPDSQPTTRPDGHHATRPGSGPGADLSADAAVRELEQQLRGEVHTSALRRALYSSDASNYRIAPRVVVCPLDEADVVTAVRIAARHGLPVTVRGGGTSIAGNAVGPGLVLDVGKHLHRIVRIDAEARSAVVQPGVVLTDLQAAAAPHGLRFGPDPSSASRCTIGGMIGNNACGPHGLAYGRTADNVRRLRWLLPNGRILDVVPGRDALDQIPGLESFVQQHLELLRTELGRFNRQISGYSLEHLLPENGRNLAAALVGTEGTCGVLLEAEVELVPRAPAPALAVIGYPDMPAAADDVPSLLPHRPLALEGLSGEMVEVVRRSPGGDDVPELPAGGGWLMVEVGGADTAEAVAAAEAMVRAAHGLEAVVLPSGPEAARLWQIRADGSGLAVRTAAGAHAWPGWEDAAVPPEHLGSYLRDLKELMDGRGLSGLAYGHFGDGCIHMRIDFPFASGSSEFREFMESAAKLVARYGGSLAGEHGDGRARSELLPAMYSPQALEAFARFKALFDPAGLMNPGVMVDPDPIDAALRRPASSEQRAADGFAFADDDGSVADAVHRCVGIGKCRADLREQGTFMCPSYLATGDDKDSTRGRARVLQEMLNGGVVTLGWESPEVHEALDLCLSCKACASDCPTGVDMATYKSETLHRTYRGKVRPLAHYTLGRLPFWLRLAAPMAPLVNAAGRVPVLRRAMMTLMGADPRRSLPRLPRAPFRWSDAGRVSAAAGHRPEGGTGSRTADVVPPAGTGRPVVLWVDSFSDALSPEIPADALMVLAAAGCAVEVVGQSTGEQACCGLTLISTGQLTAAKEKLRRTVEILLPHVRAGRAVVGLEPSCTATLRSDLVELLPEHPGAREVASAVRTVAELLTELDWAPPRVSDADRRMLVQPHCHHHAVMGYSADEAILDAMGCDVETSNGCCGLAGNFGMEQGHYEVSETIARQGILSAAERSPDRALLADGFSCRTQVKDLAGLDGRHLVQVIADALRTS